MVSRVGSAVYVPGWVVVVPPRGSTMRLDKKLAPDGCTVLLCENHNPLRAWLHKAHRSGGIAWTADQAYALVDALECGDRTTVAELAAEGLPRRQADPPLVGPPTMPRPSPTQASYTGSHAGSDATPSGLTAADADQARRDSTAHHGGATIDSGLRQ